MCLKKIAAWLKDLYEDYPDVPPPPPPPPEPIQYLVFKEDARAPVWSVINGQVDIGTLRDGDTVPIRSKHMQGDQLWFEVLLSAFPRFLPYTVGWVKWKDAKMLTAWQVISA